MTIQSGIAGLVLRTHQADFYPQLLSFISSHWPECFCEIEKTDSSGHRNSISNQVLFSSHRHLTMCCWTARHNGPSLSLTWPEHIDHSALLDLKPVIMALVRQHEQQRTWSLEDEITQFTRDKLTRREQQVSALILRGYSSRDIADELHISTGTVKLHRKNIHARLQTSSTGELFGRFLNHLRERHPPAAGSGLH